MMIWLAGFWACAPPEEERGNCNLSDAPEVIVVRTLKIAVADDAGVSAGFDLDGVTSSEGASTGCGIADYVRDDGTEGVDNAFTRIVPTLSATEAKIDTIEGLVQDTINSGELLIAFEVGGLDDWEADECVAVEAGQATGEAMLGTDGLLLDGQTFDREVDSPTAALDSGSVADGRLWAKGLSIDLPLQVLNASLTLPLRDGQIEIEREGDDFYIGTLAGAVSAAYMLEIASTENVDPTVADLLGTVLDVNADLPDEQGAACAAMSMTLTFEAVGAYYFE